MLTSPRTRFSFPHFSSANSANKFSTQPPLSEQFVSVLSRHESDSDSVTNINIIYIINVSSKQAFCRCICWLESPPFVSGRKMMAFPPYNKHSVCWQCLNFQPLYRFLMAKCNCNVRRRAVLDIYCQSLPECCHVPSAIPGNGANVNIQSVNVFKIMAYLSLIYM